MSMNEIKMTKERHAMYLYRFSWFQLIRPMTFTGTISPILVGSALAARRGQFRTDIFLWFLIAALLVQSATNIFNDYFDFKNGQDQEKWELSEDSQPGFAPWHHLMPLAAGALLLAAVFIGAWLASQSSYWTVVIGSLGILFGFAYSAGKRSLSARGFGELTAAIFLGLVPTTLAYALQGNTWDGSIIALAIPFALLISTMILSNNIRDIEKDQGFRRTLAMRLGRIHAPHLLTMILAMVYIWSAALIFFRIVPWTSAIMFLALPLAIKLRWCYRQDASRKDEAAGMMWAARHHWTFGLLFACGMWISLL